MTASLGLQEIDCIFCGEGSTSTIVIRENGFNGRQCGTCGLIFISPRPSLEAIVDLYGHGESHVPVESHLRSGFSKRLYARNSLRILRRYKQRGDILDVGAGAGFFLDEARKQGFNPFAIEFNPNQAMHISGTLGIPCRSMPLEQAPFPGQLFDVVYHCDVMSHFYDPIAEFRAFHRALRDGGVLIFETGNFGDIDHRSLASIKSFQFPDHLFFFSSRNIQSILDATGFELLAFHRYSIRLDLWATRARSTIRRAARKLQSTANPTEVGLRATQTPVAGSPGSGSAGNGIKRRPMEWAKSLDQYLSYFARYRLGRFIPGNNRPQSLIVVARKKASA